MHRLGQKAVKQLTDTLHSKLQTISSRQLAPTPPSSSKAVFSRLHYRSKVDSILLQQKLSRAKHRQDTNSAKELTFSPKISHTHSSQSASRRLTSREPSLETERLRNKLLRRERAKCTFKPKILSR
jgi:hypothetical protein